MMRYRDIEYTVVQGIERGVFKWSASVAGVVITCQEPSKSAAVAEAEKAVDRALAPKKRCDLIRPDAPIDRRDCRGSIGVFKVGGRVYPVGPVGARSNPGPYFLWPERFGRGRIEFGAFCCVGGAYARHRLDAKDRALRR